MRTECTALRRTLEEVCFRVDDYFIANFFTLPPEIDAKFRVESVTVSPEVATANLNGPPPPLARPGSGQRPRGGGLVQSLFSALGGGGGRRSGGSRDRNRAQQLAPSGPLVSDPLPDLVVQTAGHVPAFDMRDPAQAAEAKRRLQACDSPVVLRNAAADWEALHAWTLDRVAKEVELGVVRVSGGPSVVQCNKRHPLITRGLFEPPSRTVPMSGSEFVRRIQVGRTGLPPLFYGDTERVYLQSEAPPSMLAQAPVPEAWQTLGVEAAGCSNFWVSTQGLVSPLHYDATHSFLAQVPSPRP